MPETLRGKVAIVTGAGRGIGQSIAMELARRGCGVAVNYVVEPERAHATVEQLRALGVPAIAVEADVGDASAVTAMVERVTAEFGALDVFVNNAGVQTWKPFLDVTESEWDFVIDTNLKGTFLCAQAAARFMKAHGGGAIINMGSGSNKAPFPGLIAYTASRGGIEMLTKVAAVELGPFGIRVNCVAPGAIDVERTRLELPDYAAAWGAVTPLRRVGYPDDVARTVAFLAGPDASFVTGQTLWVDGGLFSQAPWVKQGS